MAGPLVGHTRGASPPAGDAGEGVPVEDAVDAPFLEPAMVREVVVEGTLVGSGAVVAGAVYCVGLW